jgi:adenosylhomocysteine nucleosidase
MSNAGVRLKKTVAIIAALEREVWPLVRHWPQSRTEYDGREYILYESPYAVVVVGGIGQELARRAAEAAIACSSPRLVISVGFAGALVGELHAGDTIFPSLIVDTQDGSRHESAISEAPVGATSLARTTLASYPRIASRQEKKQLRKSYGAHAVDMESAGVLRAAERHSLPFLAVKAISDELDWELPDMNRFLRQGRFETTRFLRHIGLRPWHWPRALRLARGSRRAAENLSAWLRESALQNTIVPSALAQSRSAWPPKPS